MREIKLEIKHLGGSKYETNITGDLPKWTVNEVANTLDTVLKALVQSAKKTSKNPTEKEMLLVTMDQIN